VRVKDGKKVCIQCAGHEPDENIFFHPEINSLKMKYFENGINIEISAFSN